eukprot:3614847-Pleurochrysis_carterae.AAC.3
MEHERSGMKGAGCASKSSQGTPSKYGCSRMVSPLRRREGSKQSSASTRETDSFDMPLMLGCCRSIARSMCCVRSCADAAASSR